MTHFGLDKKERNYKIEIHKRLHSWLRCTFFLAHCPDNGFMIEDCSIAQIRVLRENDILEVNE